MQMLIGAGKQIMTLTFRKLIRPEHECVPYTDDLVRCRVCLRDMSDDNKEDGRRAINRILKRRERDARK